MGAWASLGILSLLVFSVPMGCIIATVGTAISSRFVEPTGRSFALNVFLGVIGWPIGFITGLTQENPWRAAFIVPVLAVIAHEFVRWVRHRRVVSERKLS